MCKVESYRIRYFNGVNGSNEPIYTWKELTLSEYDELYESEQLRRFVRSIEKAYELIVFNYKDYEQFNFSIVLGHVLEVRNPEALFAARNGIDRHISNILTSTYLYTSLFRIKRKDNDLDDYSFENSKELPQIYNVKSTFKKSTNELHRERYQYTFVSALRNRLNHGGNLESSTTIGGTWSIRYDTEPNESGFLAAQKDKRFSLFDQEISKSEAKNIIDNKKHYTAVESNIPNSFYLREALRIYVDLLSNVHIKFRSAASADLERAESLVLSYAPPNPITPMTLIKYCKANEENSLEISAPKKQTKKNSVNAPLNLEHYVMPGEPSAVPRDEKIA